MEAATGALKARVDYKMQPGHYGECRGSEKESKGRQALMGVHPHGWTLQGQQGSQWFLSFRAHQSHLEDKTESWAPSSEFQTHWVLGRAYDLHF